MSMAQVKLAEIAVINPRDAAPSDPETVVSFLAMADVSTDGTTSRGQDRVFAEVSKGCTQFANNDILVAKITPCFENGKIAQAALRNDRGSGSTEFHVIRPGVASVNSRYLLHFLRQSWVRREGERRMTGSAGQRRIPASFLADLRIPLPTISEQARIVEILDRVEAVRAQRREAIVRLDELAQSIFIDMFGDPVANDRSWPMVEVSDLVERFEGGKSFMADDADDPHAKFRVIKISAVTSGIFDATQAKAVPDGYVPPRHHFVRAGDLLFSRANTSELVGATALVENVPDNLLLPDKVWRFVWRSPRATNAFFVHHLFRRPRFRHEVSSRSTGTSASMKNISQPKVLSIKFGMPPLDLQDEFAHRVSVVQKLRGVHQGSLAGLDALFASLQYRAFRGEL